MNLKQIKNLKHNRLKPEERLILDILKTLTKEESLVYEGDLLYQKDNYCYFYHDQEFGKLYYDIIKIYSSLTKKLGFNYNKNNEFVKCLFERYFGLNLNDIYTAPEYLNDMYVVKEHFKTKISKSHAN